MAFSVLTKIKHDGVIYEPGSVISEISEDEAQSLIESGAAELVSNKKENKETIKAKTTESKVSPKFKITMSKAALLEIARQNEIDADETLTRDEIYHALKEKLG